MDGSSPPRKIASDSANVMAPDSVADNPVRRPRRDLGMHFPCTSFMATEQKPRLILNSTNKPIIVRPACIPSSNQTAAAIASTAIPCSAAPRVQKPLRIG